MLAETKKHYPLSPSAAHRWLVCPGEPKLRATVENKTSSYAEEGTTAHWVGEQCLKLGGNPFGFVGKVCPETRQTVTAEMAIAVQVYVDECGGLLGTWHVVEGKFTLPWLSEDLGGTADFASFSNGVLHVRDYKHGKGYAVEVDNNPQLLIYALGAHALFLGSNSGESIKSVVYGIVQPRVEGEAVKKEKMLASELAEWRDTVLRPAIKRTVEESDTLVAGDHCRFCPAKAVCPAQYKQNLAVAQVDFAKPVAIAPPAPASLTIDQLARVLQAKDQIESWLGAIEEYAQSQLQNGLTVPGFKLVKKRANRAWKDESQAETALRGVIGDGAYAPRKLVSPAQAEEALKVFGAELSSELVIKPDTGCVIAPLSDKRPPAMLPAVVDFGPRPEFLT